MATIKEVKIERNCGVRPQGHFPYIRWEVEVGEPYDFVQYSINELNKNYWWYETLALPINKLTDEEIKMAVELIAMGIKEQDILDYKHFLEDGERWGWD